MKHGRLLTILLASLTVADGAAAAGPGPLMVMSDDAHVPDNPESEAFRFHGGLLAVTLRFDQNAPSMKLVGLDATCNGRRTLFAVKGDYYAYWNNPHGEVHVDRRGKFVLARFGLSLTTELGAKVRNQGVVIDCDRRATTFDISERGTAPGQ
ncbi:MAG TPA: hypothetical protein VGL73_09995 [Caulobacteraceae bacterium]